MKYKAILGTDDFICNGEYIEFSEKVLNFMDSVTNKNNGKFEITEEVDGDISLFYASVIFPNWAEALFLIQFFDYDWELMEESE